MAVVVSAITLGMAGSGLAQQRVNPPADSRDLLLAALGSATVECLGTAGPESYSTAGGVLARTFRSCPVDPASLPRIDALLGVQFSEQGRADDLAGHYVATWNAFTESFPREQIGTCPSWALVNVIDAPTPESMRRLLRLGRPGKENRRYEVSSPECEGSGACTVAHAEACTRGFGSQFFVDANAQRNTVEVDPAWWLLDYDCDLRSRGATRSNGTQRNPTDCYWYPDDYRHGFCAGGTDPYKPYGAIERAGEDCCYWQGPPTNTILPGKFVAIECADGWYCMTYCAANPKLSAEPTPTP
jgi:hypothetical protein